MDICQDSYSYQQKGMFYVPPAVWLIFWKNNSFCCKFAIFSRIKTTVIFTRRRINRFHCLSRQLCTSLAFSPFVTPPNHLILTFRCFSFWIFLEICPKFSNFLGQKYVRTCKKHPEGRTFKIAPEILVQNSWKWLVFVFSLSVLGGEHNTWSTRRRPKLGLSPYH